MSVFVDKPEAQSRFDVCKACSSFRKTTFQCRECGCFMKAKVTLVSSSCPLGKW